MKLASLFLIKYLVVLTSLVEAAQVAPFLLASHRLVPGLQDEMRGGSLHRQSSEDASNMVKKLVSECSSDIFLLVNVPGLKNSDLLERKRVTWPHLRNYLHMASSLVSIPWVEGIVDLEFLERYIVHTCKAEVIRSFGNVEQYIDTRTRVIRYEADPLPEDETRGAALHEVDEAIRRILRISPSPHYTILLTSADLHTYHPVPSSVLDSNPEFFVPFHDIVNHDSRSEERERNSFMYNDVEPYWNLEHDPTDVYLRKKKADDVHLWDDRLWKDNERLIMTVLLMALSLALFQSVSIMLWITRKCEMWTNKKKHD